MKKISIALLVFSALSNSVNAAQVCAGKNGVYGGVTLTRSGACSSFGPYDGLTDTANVGDNNICTFAFSPAVSASQLRVKLSDVDFSDQVGFSFGATSYTLVPADVDTVTTPPNSAGSLSIVGNQLTSPTSGVAGAGTISFTNSPPASIQSLDVIRTGVGPVILQVCFDDASVAASPAAIPTLGEWGMIFMASLMAMFGIRRMRRNK
jgi:hypothetical protein